ncbi:Charged multivesicular body protein 1b [Chytridiales sp. JEL 0842]|nr:Charged multivesicular body protein 1b [Chytridiales sp. JEL 0842]
MDNTNQLKTLKALQTGNVEVARLHASNAIRKKSESLNFLRLSARVDAAASRVETAVKMRQVTGSMTSVVKNMERAMNSMNLEQISMVMDKFEQQFEDLDVQTAYMEGSMSQSTAMTTPIDQVDDLMQQVADENGLELQMELPGVESKGFKLGTATIEGEQDELAERLAKLRNP